MTSKVLQRLRLFPIKVALTFTLLIIAAGCGSKQPLNPPVLQPYQQVQQGYWRAIRFKIAWPKGQADPNWGVDALIAHKIVGPITKSHAGSVPLWRFHRRALQDASGHQFSYLFYASAKETAEIIGQIQQSALLKDLIDSKTIQLITLETEESDNRANIEAMSDPRWTPALQKSWPYYAMGVSIFWLDLIGTISAEEPIAEQTPAHDLLVYYAHMNSKLATVWTNEGSHALLHHLNALFAYEPVQIGTKMSY